MALPGGAKEVGVDGYLDARLVAESRERLARLLSETSVDRQTPNEHLQRVIEELSTCMS